MPRYALRSTKKPKLPKAKSEPEERFALTWKVLNGPEPEREYRFHPTRQWRFDFAWPDALMAVEIDGGVKEGKHRGYHMRQEGYAKDCLKLAEAALLGYRVIRLTPPMIQPVMLERIRLEINRCL